MGSSRLTEVTLQSATGKEDRRAFGKAGERHAFDRICHVRRDMVIHLPCGSDPRDRGNLGSYGIGHRPSAASYAKPRNRLTLCTVRRPRS
jgi:hypothetical protein